MRHRKKGVKLNRTSSHRDAMFRNMVTSLFKHESIKTTDVKAKELRKWADNMITLAKRGDLHARRQAMAVIREKAVVHKLFDEAEERFGKSSGGYTRITKIGFRTGDAAPMSIIELITSSSDSTQQKASKEKSDEKQEAEVKAAVSESAFEEQKTVDTDNDKEDDDKTKQDEQ